MSVLMFGSLPFFEFPLLSLEMKLGFIFCVKSSKLAYGPLINAKWNVIYMHILDLIMLNS